MTSGAVSNNCSYLQNEGHPLPLEGSQSQSYTVEKEADGKKRVESMKTCFQNTSGANNLEQLGRGEGTHSNFSLG